MLRWECLEKAPTSASPFCHIISDDLLPLERREDLDRDFPRLDKVGFFPVEELSYGPAFAELLGDLGSPAFSAAVGGKLGVGLTGRPRMVVVRRWSAARDGRPHTDGPDKAATALIYLNQSWEGQAGALRYLEGPDVEGPGTEAIPARYGAFTAFARSDSSWHGHPPFAGERRVVQLFWLVDEAAAARKAKRHRRAGLLQRWFPKRRSA